MSAIPEDIMVIANEIVDRIAKVHPWKGDCVADVASAILSERNSLTEELTRLREALSRQSDNMAFVINHHSMHDSWYEKFQRELEEDRAALSPATEKKS